MLHQQKMREAERAEVDREYQRGLAFQQEYNRKLQDILSRPTSNTTSVHPFRKRDTHSLATVAQLDLSMA